MNRTRLRLAGFAALLASLFAGGYLVGEQFPTHDDAPVHEHMDHSSAPVWSGACPRATPDGSNSRSPA
jgi:hypothetical protein